MLLNREKLLVELARSGLTIGDLAVRSGLSRSAVDSALRGKSIRPKSAGLIAQALGVDVVQLQEGVVA